jgi:preprotein translocase subunit SecD
MVMMRWIAIILLAFPAIGLAQTEPEFYLCSPYVEKSTVGGQTDLGWPVYVKLTEVGTTSLEAFTEANTGKMIRILVGSREFSRATIWLPIPSGNLHGTFSSQEVATDWQRTLTGKPPAAPCGAWN